MGLLEKLLEAKVRKEGYNKRDGKKVTKQQVLENLDAGTIQLMAAMPSSVMDSVWQALGVEDEREGKLESE